MEGMLLLMVCFLILGFAPMGYKIGKELEKAAKASVLTKEEAEMLKQRLWKKVEKELNKTNN